MQFSIQYNLRVEAFNREVFIRLAAGIVVANVYSKLNFPERFYNSFKDVFRLIKIRSINIYETKPKQN